VGAKRKGERNYGFSGKRERGREDPDRRGRKRKKIGFGELVGKKEKEEKEKRKEK